MSYLVLARKWRPSTFDEVVGQEHVTRTLKNAIERDRVAHALLFTGSRGVGKTTCARILARALNCERGPTVDPCGECAACAEIMAGASVDVFEIDGASNNSVEQIREIRESVKFLPTRGKRKMYIIDEVHMLSTSAFNALLKTLEEPPEHVLFVFATTEPHKIPETIHSRCQRFDFKRIPERKIVDALKHIAGAEGLTVEETALGHIAREAKGGMRDSLSLLDQVIAFCGDTITEAQAREVLGIADRKVLHELTGSILAGEGQHALRIIDELFQFGLDLQKFAAEFLKHVRDLMVIKVCADPGRLVDLPDAELQAMADQVRPVHPAQIHRLFNALVQGAEEVGRSPFPKLVLEMTLLRLCQQGTTLPLDQVLDGLARLEARLDDEVPSGGGGGGGGGGPRPSARRPEVPTSSGFAAAAAVESVSVMPSPTPASSPTPVASANPFARLSAAVDAKPAQRPRFTVVPDPEPSAPPAPVPVEPEPAPSPVVEPQPAMRAAPTPEPYDDMPPPDAEAPPPEAYQGFDDFEQAFDAPPQPAPAVPVERTDPEPEDLDAPVAPLRLDDGRDTIEHFDHFARQLRRRQPFLGSELAQSAVLQRFDTQALVVAVEQETRPTFERWSELIERTLFDCLDEKAAFELIPCEPGDRRLEGETLYARSERLAAERRAARVAAARQDPMVRKAIAVFDAEIVGVTPR